MMGRQVKRLSAPRYSVAAVVLTTLAAAGCARQAAPTEGVICDRPAEAGIAVTVLNRATGTLASGAMALAISGTYRDSGVASPYGPIFLAIERPGVYAVMASGPGYLRAAVTGIAVTPEVCGVSTQRLTLWLAPDTAITSGSLTMRGGGL